MHTRFMGLVGAATLSAALLAGVSAPYADDVNLRMTTLSGQTATAIQAAWDEYKKTHPNVTLDLEVQSDENNFRSTAPATIFNSDDGPDLSWWWCATSYQWKDMIAAGLLAPLDDVWDKNYSKASVDYYTYSDGHKYGVNSSVVWSPYVYYNKKIFADLKIDPPTTWDQLYAASDKIRAAGFQPIVSNFDWNIIQELPDALIMRSFSSDRYLAILTNWSKTASETDKQVKWTDPDGVAIFTKLKEIADHKLLGDGFAGSSDIQAAMSLFTSGKAAMYQNGSWDANGNLAGGNFDVGYFYYPPMDQASYGKTGGFLANCYIAFNHSKHLDAAKDFIKYLASHDGNLLGVKASGLVPARTDYTPAETGSIFKPLTVSLLTDASTNSMPPLPESLMRPDLLDEFKRITGEVLTGVTQPNDAAKRLQDLWEKARAE
jgi:ABC-type glycerol-3-phosphate transport system substrate-binding protein